MASKTILVVLCLVAILMGKERVDAVIGVNWGRESAQRLIPSTVVDLFLQNGVKEARIYTSREDLLKAFAGTGIGLSVTHNVLNFLKTPEDSHKWIQSKIAYFNVSNVRRVYVGMYPFVTGLTDKATLQKSIVGLENLQTALNEAGMGKIKAVFSHNPDELKPNISRPSDAEFRDEIKEEMAASLRILEQNDSPFVIDFIPNLQVQTYNLDPLFSFVGESRHVVKDLNGAAYANIFDFMHDSFIWAIRKLAVAPDVKIVVGQIGWPTDGYHGCNISATERFFKGLLPHVASTKGTPLRPGTPVDTFVHALTDENKLPLPFMRHWGIYRSNGKPKFKIDLTGRGRDMYPPAARGIYRMPARWCVFNGNRTDHRKVTEQLHFAYKNSDCSSVQAGGQCSLISFEKHMSYAFNMYFQFQYQDEKACDFAGLGYITAEDPSTDDCEFPVEVVKGQQEVYVPAAKSYYANAAVNRIHNSHCIVSLFLFSIFVSLFWN